MHEQGGVTSISNLDYRQPYEEPSMASSSWSLPHRQLLLGSPSKYPTHRGLVLKIPSHTHSRGIARSLLTSSIQSMDHIKLLRAGTQCFKRIHDPPDVFGESASVDSASHPFSGKASVNRQLFLRALTSPLGKYSRLIRTAGRTVTPDDLPLLIL